MARLVLGGLEDLDGRLRLLPRREASEVELRERLGLRTYRIVYVCIYIYIYIYIYIIYILYILYI